MKDYRGLGRCLQMAGYGPSFAGVLAYFLDNEQGTQWDITQTTGLSRPAVLEAVSGLNQRGWLTSQRLKSPEGDNMVYARALPVKTLAELVYQDFDRQAENLSAAQTIVKRHVSKISN